MVYETYEITFKVIVIIITVVTVIDMNVMRKIIGIIDSFIMLSFFCFAFVSAVSEFAILSSY